MTFSLRIMARELAAAVSACGQFADTKSPVAVLKSVRISISTGVASFVSTNTMQTIRCEAACEGEGSACIDANFLAPKTAALRQNEPVNLDGDGKIVTISQGKSKWRVPVYIDDFPLSVAEPVGADPVEVGADFIAALKNIRPGALNQDTGHAYSGVWLDDNSVIAVDGRQMRAQEHAASLPVCILPVAAVDKITALFKEGCTVRIDTARAQFSRDGITVITRLFDGKPMEWRKGLQGFRDKSAQSCIVPAEDFALAIRRAAAIGASGEKAGSFVNMQLRMRPGKIEVFTRNAVGEEGEDEIAVEREGDADIGINGGLLIDALGTLPAGKLRLSHGDNSAPIILEPEASDLANLRVVFPRYFT